MAVAVAASEALIPLRADLGLLMERNGRTLRNQWGLLGRGRDRFHSTAAVAVAVATTRVLILLRADLGVSSERSGRTVTNQWGLLGRGPGPNRTSQSRRKKWSVWLHLG